MYRTRLLATLAVLLLWFTGTVFPPAAQSIPVAVAAPAAAPAAFGKTAPEDKAIDQPAMGLVISWSASEGTGVTYSYCMRLNKSSCQNHKWINVGTATQATVKNLNPGGTYYWQVRAKDNTGAITYADGGTMWSFKVKTKPGAFVKSTPENMAIDQHISGLQLSWTPSAGATRYEYCADTTNNNVCNTSWVNAGLNTSATASGLIANAVYYWQVRAVNESGTTDANTGTWWQFTTHELSAPFDKITPADQSVNQPVNNLIFSWTFSDGSTEYEYCYDTSNNNTCDLANGWIKNGLNTSAPVSGLLVNKDYYWQVRAYSAGGYQYANNNVWWHFYTQADPPAAFTKADPISGTLNTATSLTLSWNESTGVGITYEYCVDQTDDLLCDDEWVPTGAKLTGDVTGLIEDTMYYWQVRATNATDTVEANGGTWWAFTTHPLAPPTMFVKSNPADQATGLPINLNLQWSGVDTDVTYEYCLVPGAGSGTDCATGWKSTGASTTVNPGTLTYNTQYSWTVRATNASQLYTYSNDGAWWTFKTQVEVPDSFAKLTPWDGDIHEPLDTWLYWTSTSATRYDVCLLETTLDTTCAGNTKWVSAGTNTSYHLTGSTALNYGKTYYWQVRAVSGTGGITYADGSGADAWYSFETLPTPPTSANQQINMQEDKTLNNYMLAFTNPSGGDVHFNHVGATPPGLFALGDDGAVSYAPPQDFNDTVSFQFTVSDGLSNPSGPYTVTIVIAPQPDPPVIDPIASQTVRTGQLVTFTASASDPDQPDGDVLKFKLEGSVPPGATIDEHTGVFTWTAKWSASQPTYTFTVTVTDSDLPNASSAHTTVSITVKARPVYIAMLGKN